MTLEEKCFLYHITELLCFHEEADARMIFHVSKSKKNSRIMVKATGTDVLILLLGRLTFYERTNHSKGFSEVSQINDCEKVEKLQKFTSLMCSITKCNNVNSARSIVFQKMYSPKKDNENLIKKIGDLIRARYLLASNL